MIRFFGLIRIVTQEIDRLTNFTHGVEQRLACLLSQGRKDQTIVFLVKVRRLAQHRRTFRYGRIPHLCVRNGAFNSRAISLDHGRDGLASCGVDHRNLYACGWRHRDWTSIGQDNITRGKDRCQRLFIAQIPTLGVCAPCAENLGRENEACWGGRGFDRFKRVGRDQFRRNGFVHDLVHKRRVRAVFEQATHKVSEQVTVRTHGRINAAAAFGFLEHAVVQTFAHAMESLEFKRTTLCHFQNSGNSMRVMRRELRVDAVGVIEQLFRV